MSYARLSERPVQLDEQGAALAPMRRELVRRGLPRNYVDRVIAELDDHRVDAAGALQDMGADPGHAYDQAEQRLGNPSDLAERIVSEYRGRTFVGRHPSLIFGLLPVPLTVAAFALYGIVGGAACLALYEAGAEPTLAATPPALLWLTMTLFFGAAVAPFAAVAYAFCRLARRTLADRQWRVSACGQVALVAAMYHGHLQLGFHQGDSRVMIAVWPLWGAPPAPVMQALQMAVPLAVGAWFALVATRRRQDELAPIDAA